MKFRTQYDKHSSYNCSSGNSIKTLYSPKYNKDGVLELFESGVEDLSDYINSFRDSTDIHVILKRFAAGETSLLSQRQGIYADFSEMPKTYAEMLNRIVEGQRLFDSLPSDVRGSFNNSFSEFISQFGTEEWLKRMHVDVVHDSVVEKDVLKESEIVES